eukprot:358171-Chlamydomonas_euryale.AAC.1
MLPAIERATSHSFRAQLLNAQARAFWHGAGRATLAHHVQVGVVVRARPSRHDAHDDGQPLVEV